MNTNKLPEYFAIKRNAKNPLWNKYIKWLNETYNLSLAGDAIVHIYYGWAGKKDDLSCYYNNILDFPNPVTELTLEQWDNIVNDTFVLPEKWYTIPKNTEEKQLLLEFTNRTCNYENKYNSYIRSHIPTFKDLTFVDGYYKDSKSLSNFKEITFEQFCKYVLKQENMNKEIIGYKLIKPEYKEAALKLCKVSGFLVSPLYDFTYGSINYSTLKEAGVLDLWFEPVYEKEKTLPKIGSFEGTYQNGIVTYGCQSFSSEFIKTIANADSIDNMTIKGTIVTKQQIKEIYEYIKSKD